MMCIETAQDVLEQMFKEVDPATLVLAVHNVFTHGENLEKHGIHFTDDELEEIFNHLEGLSNAVRVLTE